MSSVSSNEVAEERPQEGLVRLLRERVVRLLTAEPSERELAQHGEEHEDQPGLPVREAIVEVATRLNRPGWKAYLVGGTLRDLLIGFGGTQWAVPRDVDIVVDGATREELQQVLAPFLLLERQTRFGGLHLSREFASAGRVVFDVWTLAGTWGFQSKGIPPRIEDFPGTTFLNIDSCAVELQRPESGERQFFDQGFFEGIAERLLDLNYEENPFPHVCAVRSLVLAAQLNFAVTRRLARFVCNSSKKGGVDALTEAQESHYGMVRVQPPELRAWLREIEDQDEAGQATMRLNVSEARRRALWSNRPSARDLARPAVSG
jgi:hypothetical protein